MGGAVPPLPNTPSWRDAQLGGAQKQLYYYYYYYFFISPTIFSGVLLTLLKS
jgi:hypothetical protein